MWWKTTTRSPGLNWLTRSPAAATTPEVSWPKIRGAAWDPVARLHDMDMTGVWASLCFGSTIWGFAGTRFSTMSDRDLGLACLRAYNDWMMDEWITMIMIEKLCLGVALLTDE